MKTFLIRSSEELIKQGMVGYGYKKINFSLCNNITSLATEFKRKGIDRGRNKRQTEHFFNIKKGDRIIVPLNKHFVIGYAEGKQSYDPNTKLKYAQNRQHVKFLKLTKVENKNVAYIPRHILNTKLQQRLKVRFAVNDLSQFDKDFALIENRINNDKSLQPSIIIAEKIEAYIDDFKKKLIKILQKNENITLKAGGQGLELLIKELLELEGYSEVKILEKSNTKGKGDIDIKALKIDFSGIEEVVFCQIKHHKNISSKKAIDQLIEARKTIKDSSNYTKYIAITTALFKEDDVENAKEENIICMDGILLTDWIVNNLSKLKSKTLASLGIGIIPHFF
jgi:restriction system protein